MRGQPVFWDVNERYERLSAVGDPLEKLNSIIPRGCVREAVGQGAEALRRIERRTPAVSGGVDVQDLGAAGPLQSL